MFDSAERKYKDFDFSNGNFVIDASESGCNYVVRAIRRAPHGDFKTQSVKEEFMGLEQGEEGVLCGVLTNFYGCWARVLKSNGKIADIDFLDLDYVEDNRKEYVLFDNNKTAWVETQDIGNTGIPVCTIKDTTNYNKLDSPLTAGIDVIRAGVDGVIVGLVTRPRKISPERKKNNPTSVMLKVQSNSNYETFILKSEDLDIPEEFNENIRDFVENDGYFLFNATDYGNENGDGTVVFKVDADIIPYNCINENSKIDSTDDARTTNNVMRHEYRKLDDTEKKDMKDIKDRGLEFHDFLGSLGESRELSLAKTKIEEAVMWAVKHITK